MQANAGSAVADSAVECAEYCDALAGCNGASYYDDKEALGLDSNCWLKAFLVTCDIPADSVDDADAMLIIKPTPDCMLHLPLRSSLSVLLISTAFATCVNAGPRAPLSLAPATVISAVSDGAHAQRTYKLRVHMQA